MSPARAVACRGRRRPLEIVAGREKAAGPCRSALSGIAQQHWLAAASQSPTSSTSVPSLSHQGLQQRWTSRPISPVDGDQRSRGNMTSLKRWSGNLALPSFFLTFLCARGRRERSAVVKTQSGRAPGSGAASVPLPGYVAWPVPGPRSHPSQRAVRALPISFPPRLPFILAKVHRSNSDGRLDCRWLGKLTGEGKRRFLLGQCQRRAGSTGLGWQQGERNLRGVGEGRPPTGPHPRCCMIATCSAALFESSSA
jgi:hypothetical protein